MSPLLRPLLADELPEADRIFRLAFGTFNRLPDPMTFTGDAAVVRSRFHAFPEGAFGVELDGHLAGSVFASRWGSFGFFGPLTVAPDHWGRGLARVLLEAVMERFIGWGTTHEGLYTYPHSIQHLELYGSFGFRPRFLTLVMEKALEPVLGPPALRFSELADDRRREAFDACRALSGSLHPGLDLAAEIEHLQRMGLGDTLLLEGKGGLAGFALCHIGAGSEAGSSQGYLKFAAARDADAFAGLLKACEAFTFAQGQARLCLGVNTARTRAWEQLRGTGYRPFLSGIAMHRPDGPGFCREDAYVIDDWR